MPKLYFFFGSEYPFLLSSRVERNVAAANMGSLLKCYRPFFSLHLGMHRFTNPKRRIRCLSATTSTHSFAAKSEMPASSSELWLHNTMSRKKELFKPKVEGRVGMYVCGVTAYDLSHIGHARVYVTFDVLYRSFFFFLSRILFGSIRIRIRFRFLI